jgi:hypothetical protein
LLIAWQVVNMRQFRFRALITLDEAGPPATALHPPARQYPSHTRALGIAARPLRCAGPARYFPAEIWRDGDRPLQPGDHVVVTFRVTDDEATAYFGAGQRFTLWSGGNVGHGTVARRVFTDYGPS